MTKGIRVISNKNMSLSDELVECKRPEIVYIPLVNHCNFECESLVKKGDKVLKGSVIGKRNDKIDLPIHSSVSGKVLGIEEKLYLNGEKVKCVVIENDLREKQINLVGAKPTISSYSKSDFIKLLKECAVVGMGGSDFPAYIKYQGKLKTIIVNAIECEPYVTADSMIIKKYADEILETVDAIMEINNIEQGIIAIREGHSNIRKMLEQYIGTYPKITIVSLKNVYPMGWEKMLIEETLGVTYDKLPIEKGIVVNNVSTIYAIYKALKFKRPISRRIVTVTGESISEPRNILIKIGTSMKDVITEFGGYKETSKVRFIAGGPMMGTCVESDELIVTKNLNCVLVIPDKDEDALPCIRCGQCIDVCPANICPVLIKDKVRDFNSLKYLHPEKCIECGLCSYICPSKIRIRESVREAKKEIRRH
ncbi:MAG: RnfABCDGE type electron transport complex subunit C [Bacilli bacterium]|nr:RnfABCDGE type electron transport complex subunit C [Bacilli bacterium]MDD3305286.1 RnfABCDGE type electron transport complex subunit C [Bacilli bacterium]MDD4053576.1 RnfABCDGE type electron transport complex subunit C [Bacilli bacterium]MDD4411457.1 RnfABCDGE type electron transport complex subunit C [Bacilli bacterium]